MVCTFRFEYYGRVIIVISVDIGRLLLRVYTIVPTFVSIIIIIVVIFIIFSRYVVLVIFVIVWLGVRDFMLQSVKDFQSNRVSPCEPSEHLANASGER